MATSVRLRPEIEARLDALAKSTGRTKAFYIRELIERGLEDVEDYYIADARYQRYLKGEERTYSLEEVSRGLGLDDQAA
ncbi:MAG: DUF6290 family protein [Mesorhizobium sp.]|nr:DUF6290 family protein [Mesorhizobium sp.]